MVHPTFRVMLILSKNSRIEITSLVSRKNWDEV